MREDEHCTDMTSSLLYEWGIHRRKYNSRPIDIFLIAYILPTAQGYNRLGGWCTDITHYKVYETHRDVQ